MVTAALGLFLVLFALVGAGVGYFIPPLLSNLLDIPPAYWDAHPWYQRTGAIIGIAVVVGSVLLIALGFPAGF